MLHGNMFSAIIRAPMRFFDTNSIGRNAVGRATERSKGPWSKVGQRVSLLIKRAEKYRILGVNPGKLLLVVLDKDHIRLSLELI